MSGDDSGNAPAASDDLTEQELSEVEKRYTDTTPTQPCPVCGDVDWSLQAFGSGRETWACRESLAEHHGGHAGNRQDWEHYRRSSHEKASGDSRIAALLAEVRRRRAKDGGRIERLELELARAAGIAQAHGAHDYVEDFMRVAQDRDDFDEQVSKRP